MTTSDCSSCGAPLRAAARDPLGECPVCGQVVLREGAREWGLLRAGDKARIVSGHVAIASGVAVLAPLLGWATHRPFSLWDALLWFAGGLAVGILWRGLRL